MKSIPYHTVLSLMHFNAPFSGSVAAEDYVDGTYNVTFIPESTTAELQVPIVDDIVCEDEEVFFGNIMIPSPLVAVDVMAGPQITTTITIQDDDGKCMHTAY